VSLISKRQLPTMGLVGMDLEVAMVDGVDGVEGGVDGGVMEDMVVMVDGEAAVGDGVIPATFGVNSKAFFLHTAFCNFCLFIIL